jgi:NCAIR mutase (PurE)-related protein
MSLKKLPFAEMGFAKIDHHRILRQGFHEAVYGPGKTPDQCGQIVAELLSTISSGPVLLTKASFRQAKTAIEINPGALCSPSIDQANSADITYQDERGAFTLYWRGATPRTEKVAVITAGTADLEVANECVTTLQAYGLTPDLITDCGLAGMHRLFPFLDQLQSSDAVVVVAGMEGALATAVGGVTAAPLVAVPTSVGYGAAFSGITALLSMLSSCAQGVSVVGIDNGFGAGMAVLRILNRRFNGND